MERASTVDNPASHCITIHRRDGYDLLPVNTVKRWAPDVPVTGRGPYPGSWHDRTTRPISPLGYWGAWMPLQRLPVSTACPSRRSGSSG